MSENLTRSRDAVRKTGGATKYLLGLSVALMFALAGVFAHLSNRQNALQDSIREDALWAVYQFDRESRTLSQTLARHAALARPTADDVKALTLRYDILFSRLSILSNGKYQAYFEQSARVDTLRPRARAWSWPLSRSSTTLRRARTFRARRWKRRRTSFMNCSASPRIS